MAAPITMNTEHAPEEGSSSHEEQEAKARLMAAAPDMLSALKTAEKYFGYWVENQITIPERWPFDADWGQSQLKEIRSAIAKAVGSAESLPPGGSAATCTRL